MTQKYIEVLKIKKKKVIKNEMSKHIIEKKYKLLIMKERLNFSDYR
jgi:hypothetical protein